MKKLIAALFALPLAGLQAQSIVNSFDDIQFWVGSGSKESVVVLQWNDGKQPTSLAWGFRWDGEKNGIQMLTALAGTTVIREPYGGPVVETLSGADPRIVMILERYGFGDVIYSLVYNDNGAVRTAADWSSSFWQYSLFAGEFDYFTYNSVTQEFDGPFLYDQAGSTLYNDVQWFEAPIGASDRTLVDGSWDGWSFAPGFIGSPIQQPVAANLPLPSTTVGWIGSQPAIRWNSLRGVRYQVQYASAPGGPWLDSGALRNGTGEAMEHIDTSLPRPPNRFYRIAVSQVVQ
jgi:hypothetical protein